MAARNDSGTRHVFWAKFQTAGRGQRGRAWIAPEGSALLATLLLREGLSPFGHTMLASVALSEAIESVCGISPEVKWPNDLVISEKKVAGILTETSDLAPGYFAVGTGVNLTWPDKRPSGVPEWATALSLQGRISPTPGELLLRYVQRLDTWLSEPSEARLTDAWTARLWKRGQEVTIRQGEGIITGVLRGTRDDGALLLGTPDGRSLAVISGELSLPGQMRRDAL